MLTTQALSFRTRKKHALLWREGDIRKKNTHHFLFIFLQKGEFKEC